MKHKKAPCQEGERAFLCFKSLRQEGERRRPCTCPCHRCLHSLCRSAYILYKENVGRGGKGDGDWCKQWKQQDHQHSLMAVAFKKTQCNCRQLYTVYRRGQTLPLPIVVLLPRRVGQECARVAPRTQLGSPTPQTTFPTLHQL